MRNLIILLSLFCGIACGTDAASDQTKSNANPVVNSDNLDWLVGFWARKNDEEGKRTYEYWTKKAADRYVGLGYTLQKQDTVFKEELSLIKIDGIWNLEVTGVNEKPTRFVFSQQSANYFICENEENEFPKKIEYKREQNLLSATISGGENEMLFLFEKMITE